MAGDKLSELQLRQPRFTYRAWGPFTKHCQRVQKFKETDNLKLIYKSKLDKTCFAHDTTYSDSKDLPELFQIRFWKRAYEIAINPKYIWWTSRFTYRAWRPFTKHGKRVQKFKETDN